MATSLVFDEAALQAQRDEQRGEYEVEMRAGGRRVRLSGEQFERAARHVGRAARYRQPRQAGLDVGEPDEGEDDGRAWTLEDEFNASEALLAATDRLKALKEEVKEAKLDADEAAATWKDVHRKVKRAKTRGEW